MLLMIHFIFVALFVILGIIFLCGKGSFLIAGYNTASKVEKEKIDENSYVDSTGNFPFIGEIAEPAGAINSQDDGA